MSARRFFVGLCALVSVWMVTSASAFASAPETPSEVTVESIKTHSAVLHGVLNPNAEGEAGTYEFLYKASGSECQGAGTARGLAFGLQAENVSQEVTGLSPNTEYAVCLLARTLGGETALGPVATFKTERVLEAPVAEAPTEVTTHSAVLRGILNPMNPGPSSGVGVYFLYAESSTSCQGGRQVVPETTGDSSLEQDAISDNVSVAANTTYTFCLVAQANGETAQSAPFTFTTATAAPEFSSVGAASVGASEATLMAVTKITGLESSYYVEYGPSLPYAFSTPEQRTSSTTLQLSISNLQPNVLYHFRFIASNSRGTVESADHTFTTRLTSLPSGLPEGRVYELVTPPDGFDTEVYPTGSGATADETEFPYQAAVDGNAVTFPGGPTVGGSENSGYHGGNQYLATRNPAGGWSEVNLSPTDRPSVAFQAFDANLTVGFLDGVEPLTPSAPGYGEEPEPSWEGNYDVLYADSTKASEYSPFFTVKPPFRAAHELQTEGEIFKPSFPPTGGFREGRMLAFAGASADDSHLLFLANDALTGASEGRPAAEGGPGGTYASVNNLYESLNGVLRLVNVLPDGSTHVNATFGGGPLFSRVISADGSRIFWTDLSTGHIYMRENGTTTVEVAPASKFQTASSDGSVAFFTKGDLYEYELAGGVTTDLDPGVSVARVLGASEDGAYVYFSTKAGGLELWHEGQVTNIASVATNGYAEVTPDGQALVFNEVNNIGPVEVYEESSKELYCVSCSGESTQGALTPTNKDNVYQPRWISADGAHVFFESRAPLVPEDSNGKKDAYEWTKPGTGDCAEAAGCLYLLSGGVSSDVSQFDDASENGNDVFLTTRAKLVASDDNDLFDLYDLRVDGYQPVAPPACTGSGCQGLPGAPPIFATPSSVTFEGVGNFSAAESQPRVKPKNAHKKKQKKKQKKKHKRKVKAKKSKRSASGHRKGGRS